MKGYAVLLLIVAMLLMLLPLPAFSRTQQTIAPLVSSTSESASQPTDSKPTNTDKQNEPTLKILTGDTVTTLTCREFLIRTLAFEMSPTYHPEALKAQAVAAYTYYGRRKRAQEKQADEALLGADFKAPDDTFPQNYTPEKLRERWGEHYDAYRQKLSDAVDAVLGNYMTHNDEWIDACYFSLSNGSTESAKAVWGSEVPYLQSVASPSDKLAPQYETTITLSAEQVKKALLAEDATLTLSDKPSTWFGEMTHTDTGMVHRVAVGKTTLGGTAVRRALGLRSATFSVTVDDDTFCFTTKGYGHGVGMSQYGANALAEQGYSWKEILRYYYTDIEIVAP